MTRSASQPSPNHTTRRARDKIKTVEELAVLAEAARQAGDRVVLCHGVFDLLHLGHVRHLEAARAEGTVLMVTVTADAQVHKGPGRPIFGEKLRAEMIAALGYVDWVSVNHAPSAEPALQVIRPDVYVKGSDYVNPEDDITGKIDHEREAVEQYGGELIFTKDITFSSSSLINQYLEVYDSPLSDYLEEMRDRGALDGILSLIDAVKDYRVLMVGDTIIDEYQYVSALGKTPKEHVIATQFQAKEVFAGGIIAAANHVAAICGEVEVLTVLGAGDPHEEMIRNSLLPNVRLTCLYRKDAETTLKRRFIAPGMRKLFEIYHMDDTPYGASIESDLNRLIAEKVRASDVTIVADYGHGMMAPSNIGTLEKSARFLAVNAQSNSGNMGFNLVTKYPCADYICIDVPEARLATGRKYDDVQQIAESALPALVDCSKIILTHGASGCYTYEAERGTTHIPAFTKSVIDTVGAGDAFLSVTAPLVAAGGSMADIGFVGNAAGAMKVGVIGHRSSIEKAKLLKFLTTLLK